MSQEKTKTTKRPRITKKVSPPANDGMNTLVPDTSPKPEPSESEASLMKQAENPLGNPDRG
jgi:hypothetical protein